MRILLINNVHQIKGGADRVYFNTGNLLEQEGHEVVYFSSYHPDNIQLSKGQFVNLPDKRSSSFLTKAGSVGKYFYNQDAAENLEILLQKEKPDIAHLHLYIGGLTVSILTILKKYKIPIVQTIHDYRLLCPANVFFDSRNRICEKCRDSNFYHCILQRCVDGNVFYSTIASLEAYYRKYRITPLDYVDHFIFVSKFSRDKHIEFNLNYGKRSSQLYNFAFFQEENNIAKTGSYFLYFGRLSKEKGIHTLIEASIKTGLPVKIAGTGPLAEDVRSAGTHENIEYLGYLAGEELNRVVREAAFILVPSECYENNPMAIVEAYTLGKPVIGSRLGGIPEIIEDRLTGFLFSHGNVQELARTMKEAMKIKDEAYITMSNNARSFATKNFSHKNHLVKLVSVYNKLIRDAQATGK